MEGIPYNNAIKHERQLIPMKRIRNMLNHERIRAFLKGIERRDEKMLLLQLLPLEMTPSQRILRKNTFDRSIFIVGTGEVTLFGSTQNIVLKEGGIFGCNEFLTG